MDDIIVRVLRAVACHTRLRILSHLVAAAELTPSQLARTLRLRRDLVSAHLARLDAAGLVLRRRSGSRCYCLARSPYGEATFSGQIAAWLYDALRAGASGPAGTPSSPSGRRGGPEPSPQSHRVVFDAATAATSLRRIQILRRLTQGGAADSPTLSRELHMSETAVSRHLAKLARRGYVRLSRQKHRLACQLAETPKTPLHGTLFGIVAAHWGQGTLRS